MSVARASFPGRAALGVAADLLREAAARKWFMALGLGLTLGLVVLGLSLRMEVLDGALAATQFFGSLLSNDIQSVDVALRPVFGAAASLIFFGGVVFGILACADFAPSLLEPGRIEHLLSLPVRRWELLVGTFLGVLTLGLLASLYGAGGLVLILGVKTGVWSLRLLLVALLAEVVFGCIYAVMLTTAVFARSAALSAALGGLFFILTCIASARAFLGPLFEEGPARQAFRAATVGFPRLSSIAIDGVNYAASKPLRYPGLAELVVSAVIFTGAVLAIGIWRFDEKDF